MRRALGERPGHRATTANAQAIYPFFAENGLGDGGVLIGTDLHGSAFTYDPFVLYERRVVSNPNLLVAGEVGAGKSSLVKTYLYRQALFGRVPWIADPKGEYGPLAEALGVEPIRLVPGGDVRLNPIARDAGWDGQLSLLRALAAGALARRARPGGGGRAARGAARRQRRRGGRADAARRRRAAVPAARTRWPSGSSRRQRAREACARRRARAAAALRGRPARHVRRPDDARACDSTGARSCSTSRAFYDSSALGLVMTCASAWQRGDDRAASTPRPTARSAPPRKIINVFDEAWRALSVLGVGEWLQAAFKLSRRDGVQNVVVMHRLSDLSAAGAAGSRERELAEGCCTTRRPASSTARRPTTSR